MLDHEGAACAEAHGNHHTDERVRDVDRERHLAGGDERTQPLRALMTMRELKQFMAQRNDEGRRAEGAEHVERVGRP